MPTKVLDEKNVRFLLSIISRMTEKPHDWASVATENSVPSAKAAEQRFRRLMKAYKEGSASTPTTTDAEQSAPASPAPKDGAKTSVGAAPASKKRGSKAAADGEPTKKKVKSKPTKATEEEGWFSSVTLVWEPLLTVV
jgi:hypothetical protein